MEIKDWLNIAFSLTAIVLSAVSLVISIMQFRKNITSIEFEQICFHPNFEPSATPNKLYLDSRQDMKLWKILPILYLVIYLKIDNKSHLGITISGFEINDVFKVNDLNLYKLEKETSLAFFSSYESQEKDLENFDMTVPMAKVILNPSDYARIKIGERIEAKSYTEGILIVRGNWDLYNSINNGTNKLSIITPDKKIDGVIEIDKTLIP